MTPAPLIGAADRQAVHDIDLSRNTSELRAAEPRTIIARLTRKPCVNLAIAPPRKQIEIGSFQFYLRQEVMVYIGANSGIPAVRPAIQRST